MSYSLDTNIVIALLRSTPIAILQYRQAVERGQGVFVSSVVFFELEVGIRKSDRSEANKRRMVDLLTPLPILPFTPEDARAAATLRADLERRKQPIGPYDTLIAGQALARELTLVTANTRDFSWVRGLALQDWTAKR